MKKILILCVLSVFVAVVEAGARRVPRSLAFVPADSVMFFDARRGNYRLMAAAVDTSLVPRPVEVDGRSRRALRKAARTWQSEVADVLNPVGGSGDALATEQTFAAAQAVQASAAMFLRTGRSCYMDVVERAVTNALPSALLPDASFFERRVAAQTMLDAAGMIYATDEKGVYVNLYVNSYVVIAAGDVRLTLDQVTAMPSDGRVRFRVGGLRRGAGPMAFRFRLPEWQGGDAVAAGPMAEAVGTAPRPVIYVNGHETDYEVVDGYAVVERRWRNRDEVYFDFSLQPQALRRRSDGAMAWRRGPLVYVFPAAASGAQPSAGAAAAPRVVADGPGPAVLRLAPGVEGRPYASVAPGRRRGMTLWCVASDDAQ